MRNAAYTQMNPDFNLALIRDSENFPFYKFLLLFGSNSPKFIETVYLACTVERLHVVKEAVQQLELCPSFFYRSSLRQSVFAKEVLIVDRFVNNRLTQVVNQALSLSTNIKLM